MEEENKKRIEELAREILQMSVIASFCEQAPRDSNGNVVVSVVGIPYIGLFYQYQN